MFIEKSLSKYEPFLGVKIYGVQKKCRGDLQQLLYHCRQDLGAWPWPQNVQYRSLTVDGSLRTQSC